MSCIGNSHYHYPAGVYLPRPQGRRWRRISWLLMCLRERNVSVLHVKDFSGQGTNERIGHEMLNGHY